MPLTEFLRMSKRKVEATQQRASTTTDPSCRPDTDCVELVWENGQIVMEGQSSKAKKNHVSNNFQTFAPKTQDVRNANGSEMTKFSTMDSVLTDFTMPVSSCEMGLDQDVDMVHWLNYQIEDPLHNDYTSDFLHELSGVTINDLSTGYNLASREKKSSFNGDVELRNSIDDASGNNTGNTHHVISQDSATPSSLCTFTSMRLQKLNAGQPSTSSSFTNFSHFARPTSVGRANHLNVNSSNKLQNDKKRCTLSSTNPADSTLVNFSTSCSQKETFSESLPAKPMEEILFPNQAVYQDGVAKNNASQNQADGATMAKAGMAGESSMEPVVATSSVCSGNSVERASYEPTRNLKRKSRKTGESEGPSEELEDESVDARKVALRTGSKRSRATEVHNLSERKRRDRINEKMRALQELIPNCNKVDKASMLDEAIEYLKTLQLQVQMLSMGAGLYMQPMILPPGMQPIHGAHMPHFSPMGMGVGMGMGYGMNTLDMNTGMKMMPFQGPHYPVPVGNTFLGMPGSNLQAFGHPGQGLPMSMQRPPVLPVSGVPPLKIPIGPNVSGVAGSTDAVHLAPSSSSKDVGPQVMPSYNANSSMKQGSNQAKNEGIECPATSRDLPQAVNASEAAVVTSGTDNMPS